VSDESALKPARRFLHVCYTCHDAAATVDLFVRGLAMKNTWNTPLESASRAVLGLDRDPVSSASFVFDHRGPRISPAIEIQQWADPALVGSPSIDPFEIGVKALGYSVADLPAAVDRLVSLGCSVVGRGTAPFAGEWCTLRDPRDVTIELVEAPGLAADVGQMRHLRITVGDLDTSLAFYDDLGFTSVTSGSLDDATFLGVDREVSANYNVLRLPDEGFEIILIQWLDPQSHGHHYAVPNHAGLFRAALGVDDTRASHAAMTANGAVFDRGPMSVELTGTPVPDMWISFLSDPDGVPYEFVQRPRSAFRSEPSNGSGST
jgi:catechol 2,3-dioxygenase-like lactoylglutathione lyase family enzyme